MSDPGDSANTLREGNAARTPAPEVPRVEISARYELGDVIAKGGMGEVVAAVDRQVGREVAVKRMRERVPSDRAMARFFREAMIQGRLDHPAVVPVYELGVDPDGQPFFVMKKLTGTTLLEHISNGHPREALLRAFVDVCLAVENAHQRGVIHRDLKPANVVLGDYGEVYVLDWGIARVFGAEEEASLGEPDDLDTGSGAVLGTYGYMAPEQYRSPVDVDGRTDVYALGCVLFELLAGEPLHPRGKAAVETTLAGIDARPSTRGKDVPPELETLCIGATAVDPARRIASARHLGDQIQRFLDGDRDMAQRHELALAHLDVARKAFDARAEEAGRRVAMRNAGRALALDPNLAGAAELVTRLMLEPPDKIPPEVEAAVEADNTRTIARSSRIAAWGYLGFLALVPTVFNGSGIEYVLLLVAIVAANIVLLVKLPTSTTRAVLVACANAGLVAALARVFAPFFIAPAIAAVITMALVNTPKYEDVRAVMVIAMVMTMAILAPWALERVGIVSTTTWMSAGSITFAAPANAFAGAQAASATLVLYVVALIFAAAFIGHAMRKAEKVAKHAVHLQAWQLRQLVA